MPGGEEGAEPRTVDGLDLVAKHGEGAPAEPAQHLGVDPLRTRPRRVEGPAGDASAPLQGGQCGIDRGAGQGEGRRRRLGGEGPVGSGEAGDDVAEGVLDRFEQGFRDARRGLDPERIPEP